MNSVLLEIWHANDQHAAEWLAAGLQTHLGEGFAFKYSRIPGAGSYEFLRLSEPYQRLLRLDKPDLIVTSDVAGRANPIVSIEVTATTPHGQHGKQRFARLAAAAELGIPCVYVIPYRKSAVVKGKPHEYHLGSSVPFGLVQLSRVTGCPAISFAFPDIAGKLTFDDHFPGQPCLRSTSMTDCFSTLAEIVLQGAHGLRTTTSHAGPSTIRAMAESASLAAQPDITDFQTLVTIRTTDLPEFLKRHTNLTPRWIKRSILSLPPRIHRREQTIVFRPDGRMFEKAGDPYCGMFAWCDYAFCRTGINPEERSCNLMYMPLLSGSCRKISDDFSAGGYRHFWKYGSALRLDGPKKVEDQLRISHELRYGGIFLMTKPLRIYGYLADAVIFSDALLAF